MGRHKLKIMQLKTYIVILLQLLLVRGSPSWYTPIAFSQHRALLETSKTYFDIKGMVHDIHNSFRETWKCCLEDFFRECEGRLTNHATHEICGYFEINSDAPAAKEDITVTFGVLEKYYVSLYVKEFFVERVIGGCYLGWMRVNFDDMSEVFCGRWSPWTLAAQSATLSVTY